MTPKCPDCNRDQDDCVCVDAVGRDWVFDLNDIELDAAIDAAMKEKL